MLKTILVPTDFSAPSRRGLDYAIDLAQRFRARLIVLFVVEPIPLVVPVRSLPEETARLVAEQQEYSKARMDELSKELRKRRVRFETVMTIGMAYEQIVEQAKRRKADLIVIATHGRSGLARFFLGSVAEKVVRFAPCPVLAVRDTERERRRPKRKS
jgi:nucleotide-binding universal stress UspA family protein